MKRPRSRARSRNIVSRWPHQHVTLEPGEIGNDKSRSGPRNRIPEDELWFGQLGLVSDPVGMVGHQLVQAVPSYLGSEFSGVLQRKAPLVRHLIAGPAADRVVELALKQQPPCMV